MSDNEIPDLSEIQTTPVAASVATDAEAKTVVVEPSLGNANLPMVVLKSTEKKLVTIENIKEEHRALIDKIMATVDFNDSNAFI